GRPAIIMGHEAADVISRVGTSVTGWAVGDRVTFDSTIYCGHCEFCRRGEVPLCEDRRVLGVSCEEYRQHGAFAEFVALPQRVLYRVPEGLSFEHAALVEPFSVALHALSRPPVISADRVVVIGAGMIGLCVVLALKTLFCKKIIVVDLASDRLALAKKCGATDVLNSARENALEIILGLTGGLGAH